MIGDVMVAWLFSDSYIPTALLLVLVVYLTVKFFNGRNLPPGPWGVPILGYLPFLGETPIEEKYVELRKKYGPVMSLQMGSHVIIVINTFEAVKEAFVTKGDLFMARPGGKFVKIQDDDTGILVTNGDLWKEHRRLILSTFRHYKMEKNGLEPLVMEEIHCFLDEVAKEKGEPFDVTNILRMSTANIISLLEFGKRFEYTDEKYVRLRKMMTELRHTTPGFILTSLLPWAEYIPFFGRFTGLEHTYEIADAIKRFLLQLAKEHEAKYVENSKRNYTDAYITERNDIITKTGSEGYFTDKELEGNLETLFHAGTETTTTTLGWAILFMLIHPEIQKKVQEEIDDVVGKERDPAFSDRSRMSYTEAVLLENDRCSSVSTLNVPHANYEETELCGYRIPKMSPILVNLYGIHHDPELWQDPEKFNPDRFINEDGRVERPEYLIPFGIGSRQCVGETIARMEVFLYFTSLLQRFTLKPANENQKLEFIGRRPSPQPFRAIQRK